MSSPHPNLYCVECGQLPNASVHCVGGEKKGHAYLPPVRRDGAHVMVGTPLPLAEHFAVSGESEAQRSARQASMRDNFRHQFGDPDGQDLDPEAAYWRFDSLRARRGAERDTFKEVARGLTRRSQELLERERDLHAATTLRLEEAIAAEARVRAFVEALLARVDEPQVINYARSIGLVPRSHPGDAALTGIRLTSGPRKHEHVFEERVTTEVCACGVYRSLVTGVTYGRDGRPLHGKGR